LDFKNIRINIISYSNFILVFFSFFLILSLGYKISLFSFIASLIFIFSLILPYFLIKELSKNEIKYLFVPFILKKINFKEAYETNYLKQFPCWFICNLILSSITFFKFPIFIPGRFVFIGWINPMKIYDSGEGNSENELIVQHYSLVITFNIFFSLTLFLIYPSFYSIIPSLINFYLLLPIPGNFGLDFYSMDVKKWFKMVLINFLVLITLIISVLIIKTSEISKINF